MNTPLSPQPLIERAHRVRRSRVQRGATLIEILVSVLILTLGLLGMAALQTRAIQGNLSAGQRAQAIMLSHYILDIMRVDRENAKGLAYNTVKACSASAFSGTTLAKKSLYEWTTIVKGTLGRPDDGTTCVRVKCTAEYECTVEIFWDDSKASGNSNAGAGLSNQVVTVSSRV
jgi:type IV pilus assembly protein PilV